MTWPETTYLEWEIPTELSDRIDAVVARLEQLDGIDAGKEFIDGLVEWCEEWEATFARQDAAVRNFNETSTTHFIPPAYAHKMSHTSQVGTAVPLGAYKYILDVDGTAYDGATGELYAKVTLEAGPRSEFFDDWWIAP